MDTNQIIPLIVYPQNNGYVNSINPIINGTGQPDATINLKVNNTSYGATVNQDGIWSVNINNALVDGENYTLTVVQTGKDGIDSPATSVSFVADTKSLFQHSVIMPANNQFINNPNPVVSGNGKSGATIEANIGGSNYTTIVNQNGTWNIELNKPLCEGANSISVVQKDMGNISPAVVINFVVDTIAPTSPVITKPSPMGYEATPTPTIIGEGEPDAEVMLNVDGTDYSTKANKTGNWSFEIANSLSDDMHMISAKQKDLAGNISPEATSLFTIETTVPEVPIIRDPVNGEFLSCPTPEISGIGKSGGRVEINHNGKIYSSLIDLNEKWSVKITDKLQDGKHSFNVYQVDQAGNVSPSTPLTLIVDTIAPLTPVVLYPINESFVNNKIFTIKGTGEPEATIELKLAGNLYNTKVGSDGRWSINFNDALSDSQQYSLILNQIDMAKNISPSIRVKFFVDTKYLKVPTVTFPTAELAVNTEYPTITGTGNVGATINANVNNLMYTTKVDNNGSWNIYVNQKLPQGLNNISVTQCDSGNTSQASDISFYVDTVAPVAPIFVHPTNNAIVNDSKLIIRGLAEAGSIIDIKLDNQCYSTTAGNDGMWEIIVDPIASGIHTIVGAQKDKAGNFSPPTNITCVVENIQVANYVPDGKPATGTVEYNPPSWQITTSVIATLTTNKPVIVNNVVGTVFSREITTNGVSKFDFVDLENHQGSVYLAVTWIDDTMPIIDVQSTGNYFSSDKTVNYYKAGASGLNNALLNGCTFETGKVVTTEGAYTVLVSDNAGNTKTKSFVIDKTPPTVQGVENNVSYKSDVNIVYYDNLSGIKDAFLNGTQIASGTSVTENGQYKLTVSDFGDNKADINFTIAK